MDAVRSRLQERVEQNARELQASKQTSRFDDVMESPCAKQGRVGIPALWSKLSHVEQRPWQAQKAPRVNRSTQQIENGMLLAAVASPMRRPWRSLGFANDKVKTFIQESPEVKCAATAALSMYER